MPEVVVLKVGGRQVDVWARGENVEALIVVGAGGKQIDMGQDET
jgi:hypothetical protein